RARRRADGARTARDRISAASRPGGAGARARGGAPPYTRPARDGRCGVAPATVFVAWLLPVVADTASVNPDASERARGFDQYAGQLRGTADRFSVVPELFGRTGGIAVAALLLLPLAGL